MPSASPTLTRRSGWADHIHCDLRSNVSGVKDASILQFLGARFSAIVETSPACKRLRFVQEMLHRNVPASRSRRQCSMRRPPVICIFISICIWTMAAQLTPKSNGSCGVAASGVESCDWMSAIDMRKDVTTQSQMLPVHGDNGCKIPITS